MLSILLASASCVRYGVRTKSTIPVTLYDYTESKVLTRCGNYRALLSLYGVPTTRSLFEASDVLRSVLQTTYGLQNTYGTVYVRTILVVVFFDATAVVAKFFDATAVVFSLSVYSKFPLHRPYGAGYSREKN